MTSTAPTPPSRVIDPALAAAAAKGPVDAIAIFAPPTNERVRGAVDRLEAIEAMPLGPDRKVAAFTALSEISAATRDAYLPKVRGVVDTGHASSVDELWSIGAVRVRGADIDSLEQLAGAGAAQIILDQRIPAPDFPAAMADAVEGAAEVAGAKPPKDGVLMDWGVKKMNAPAAWKQGITGAGIVVGSLDTGVATHHEVLKNNYRGTNADGTVSHDYNWKDKVKELPADGKLPDGTPFADADKAPDGTSLRPIDLNGHGTHTSGSAVGWSPTQLTGVAPDAKLIVSRGLGEKGGSMFDLVAAMEWFMAPTKVDGSAPDPKLAPDIVTNSWGGAPMNNAFLWMALRNWKRAGIIPVFASGNAQAPKPNEVAVPGMYPETITVGASDLDDTRAWFSMFGPSDYSKDRKPEVLAPGHWTYSALPNGTVSDTFPVKMPDGSTRLAPASGTSMATPHVAGAVALFLQANPGATFEQALGAIKASGTLVDEPNDQMGYGRVQVDKLITPETIAANAVRTDPARVSELMAQVEKAKVFNEGVRQPGKPVPPKADGDDASASGEEPVIGSAPVPMPKVPVA